MPWSPGSEQLLRSTCRVTEIIMESKCTWGRARLVSYCSSPPPPSPNPHQHRGFGDRYFADLAGEAVLLFAFVCASLMAREVE